MNRITFYINQEFSESSTKEQKNTKLKKDIKNHAEKQKIKTEWVVPSNFEIILTQPSNLDLAQLYFDDTDELGFINSCLNSRDLTFLQSSEYIDLPFIDSKTTEIKDITETILKTEQKDFLLSGHPGSGKSISTHKLFQVFSGLDKSDCDDVMDVLQKNNAVPMLINLKDCTFETIENLIRNRQKDCKVRGQNLGFIYLLDGLDELSAENADHVISYLYELEKDENTKKLIFSCRSGSLSKVKLKTYFKGITEYIIHDLTKAHIDKYFAGKNETNKKKQLTSLASKNKKFLSEIKDILLIKLLWDTIETLDENSTILSLLDKKIKLLINKPNHKKDIEALNLLHPKENKIIELNKEISFHFQKKFEPRLRQKEIQKIILDKYPRLDYEAANKILNYITTLFFDGDSSPSPDEPDNLTFAYQQRRYQEFFFLQYLEKVYGANPKALREFSILSNRDFFENLFLPYTRNKYTKDKDLPGIIELNLIDAYLGNRNDYIADDPCYLDSPKFAPSIAIQEELTFQELLASENFDIKNKFFIDINEVEKKFRLWVKEKDNSRSENYLKGIWTDGISSLLENIAIFWSFNKQAMANELRNNLQKIDDLFKKYKFIESFKKDEGLSDPFWNSWEDYLYLCIVIEKGNLKDIFTNLIRGNYKRFEGRENNWFIEDNEKEKLVKSFFRVCIKSEQKSFPEIIDSLNDEEMLMLLDVLVSKNYLHFLISNRSISQAVKSKVSNISAQNIQLLFCKAIFNKKITKEEKEFLEHTLKTLQTEWQFDWGIHQTHIKHAIVSYVLGKSSFEEYLKPQKEHPIRYYNALGLYAALFKDFVELLRGKKKIEAIARDYIRFFIFYTQEIQDAKFIRDSFSFLWAHIFLSSKDKTQKLLNIKKRLITKENNFAFLSFCLNLQKLNQKLFFQLINKSELKGFEINLKDWGDDFPSYVSRCFDLASFFAQIDKQKAITYIAKGINQGIVRHGWRKDPIVSYLLVEALEILWRNNWVGQEELKEYTKETFELAFRVSEITDGRGTWSGPYNVIDLVSEYDTDLATDLKNDLKNKKGRRGIPNSTISSILGGKVREGLPIDKIEEGMAEYTRDYGHEGKLNPDYYEQRFLIYLAIAQSDFYTEDERKEAFEGAYQQVEAMKEEELDYILKDTEFKISKQDFKKLCQKHKKKINITFDENEGRHQETIIIKHDLISDVDFIKKLKGANTKRKIAGLYKTLNNHKNRITLAKPESWKLLVEKTYLINQNIKLFIELLRNNYFPHSDWFSNSEYFHFGLGAALENLNTHEEMMNYLFDKTTGHGGFANVMKSYEIIGNREMCIKLFKRYLRFCDFLVN